MTNLRKIREEYEAGATLRQIALKYNIPYQTARLSVLESGATMRKGMPPFKKNIKKRGLPPVFCRRCGRSVKHSDSRVQRICGPCYFSSQRVIMKSASRRNQTKDLLLDQLKTLKTPFTIPEGYKRIQQLGINRSYRNFALKIQQLTKKGLIQSKLVNGPEGGRRRIITKVNNNG